MSLGRRRALAAGVLACAAAPLAAFDEPFEQVVVPLEVLSGATASTTGRGDGVKVELHLSLRAAGSIILDDGEVLPLAIVGRVPIAAEGASALPTDPRALAWCEHDRGLKFAVGRTFRCWQGLDADGRLETERMALAATVSRPLTVALLGTMARTVAPRAFRVARPEERIVYDLEYIPCGPSARGEYRRKLHNAPGVSGPLCPLRAEPVDASARAWRLDGLIFALEGDGARLLEVPATGMLLDRIAEDEPLVRLGERRRFDRERATALAKFDEDPFQFDASPDMGIGPVPPGGVLISGPMRYAYTGRLTEAFGEAGLLSKRELAAGSPLYGVPMGADALAGTVRLIWCSPKRVGGSWFASCLVTAPNGGVQLVERLAPAFAVTTAGFDSLVRGSRDPLPIERGPAELGGKVSVRHSFVKWAGKAVRVRTDLLLDNEVTNAWNQDLPLEADGFALLAFGDGRVRLTRTEDGSALIGIVAPIEVGASAMPRCTDGAGCRTRPLR